MYVVLCCQYAAPTINTRDRNQASDERSQDQSACCNRAIVRSKFIRVSNQNTKPSDVATLNSPKALRCDCPMSMITFILASSTFQVARSTRRIVLTRVFN